MVRFAMKSITIECLLLKMNMMIHLKEAGLKKGRLRPSLKVLVWMARYFRIAKDFIMFGHNKIRESQGTQIFICQK